MSCWTELESNVILVSDVNCMIYIFRVRIHFYSFFFIPGLQEDFQELVCQRSEWVRLYSAFNSFENSSQPLWDHLKTLAGNKEMKQNRNTLAEDSEEFCDP